MVKVVKAKTIRFATPHTIFNDVILTFTVFLREDVQKLPNNSVFYMEQPGANLGKNYYLSGSIVIHFDIC